jgi:hypothetical protein
MHRGLVVVWKKKEKEEEKVVKFRLREKKNVGRSMV